MTRKSLLIGGLLATVSVASMAFAQAQTGDSTSAEAANTTIHPIAFSHEIHAGTYKMECMYCHFSADRSVDAGMPPVATCAGCHRLIQGTANPGEIQKLMGFVNRSEQIPWTRVYKVSDHVHFPHMRHVNAGLACQQCHGPVETMGAIEEEEEVWPGNNMGECVSCHVERGARRDCAVCHY